MGGGSFTPPVAGTGRDIRYTRDKRNTVLYATILGWPASSLSLAALAAGRVDLTPLRAVELIGPNNGEYLSLGDHRQDHTGLHVALPGTPPFSAPAYVLKLTFEGRIPGLC
jgi:alpha-L-fucosidase